MEVNVEEIKKVVGNKLVFENVFCLENIEVIPFMNIKVHRNLENKIKRDIDFTEKSKEVFRLN